MPIRRKPKPKPEKSPRVKHPRGGRITVGEKMVRIECQCGQEKNILREPGEDVGLLLDREAVGWATTTLGSVVCPSDLLKKGIVYFNYPGTRVHGPPPEVQ